MEKRRVPAVPSGSSPITASLGLIALTTAALLLLGGVTPAATSFIVCAAGVLGLVPGLRPARSQNPIADRSVAATVALLGLPLLAAVQALVFIVEPWSGAPVTGAFGEFALLGAYLLFFVCAAGVARSASQARILILGLFVIGVGEAVYGSLNFLSGNHSLLFFKRWAYLDSATGTLVNRNHFAYLLEMTIPIGFLVAASATAGVRSQFERRGGHTEDSARRTLMGLPVAVMLMALALSRSRMGLASLLGASITVLLLDRVLRPAGQQMRGGAGALVVVGTALFLVFGVGIDLALERFSRAPGDLEVGRLPVWADTWRMVQAHPFLGSGLGSFEYLNASYRTGPTGLYVTHSHCDYLEVLAEAGIAGLAIVASWVALFLRRLVRTLRLPLDPARRAQVLATGIGILAVMFHSTVDFGLRVPGVALTLLLVVALFLSASAAAGRDARQRQTP